MDSFLATAALSSAMICYTPNAEEDAEIAGVQRMMMIKMLIVMTMMGLSDTIDRDEK
ncbi:unnamed protein product [Brassica oleracea]|uniref:Uncharacterized protein n=1 Tax=Brassica oleracea var. oleracea TaxID=109376 RepID=A0A0D3D7L9_BRAOL